MLFNWRHYRRKIGRQFITDSREGCKGLVEDAADLLGRFYSLCGVVVAGEKEVENLGIQQRIFKQTMSLFLKLEYILSVRV